MAKDLYHNVVREALEADGWEITHDPLRLPKEIIGAKLEIDLGVEKWITAERTTERIAVEVKSFIQVSLIHEFHGVLGQYLGYEIGLEKVASDRILYIAIPKNRYQMLMAMPIFQAITAKFNLKMIIFDPNRKRIVSWIK
jgi:XisH protein